MQGIEPHGFEVVAVGKGIEERRGRCRSAVYEYAATARHERHGLIGGDSLLPPIGFHDDRCAQRTASLLSDLELIALEELPVVQLTNARGDLASPRGTLLEALARTYEPEDTDADQDGSSIGGRAAETPLLPDAAIFDWTPRALYTKGQHPGPCDEPKGG